MKRGGGSKRELKNANRTLLNKKEKRKKLTKFQIDYILYLLKSVKIVSFIYDCCLLMYRG